MSRRLLILFLVVLLSLSAVPAALAAPIAPASPAASIDLAPAFSTGGSIWTPTGDCQDGNHC